MIAVIVAAALVAAIVAGAAGVRVWTWRPVVCKRVMVQLDTGVTFEGVVLGRRGPLLVLGDVTVHTPVAGGRGASNKADGQSVIERRRIVWIQVVS